MQLYSAIILELKELGTTNLESLSSDLQNIAIQYHDQNGEDHLMKVRIKIDNNQDTTRKHGFEIIDTDLPEKIIKIIQKVCDRLLKYMLSLVLEHHFKF